VLPVLLFDGHPAVFAITAFGLVFSLQFGLSRGENHTRERSEFLLDSLMRKRWQELLARDPDVRLCVMLHEARLSWPVRALRVVSRRGFSDSHSDRDLALHTDQGVAGKAFTTGDWALGVRTIESVDGRDAPSSRIITKDVVCEDMDHNMNAAQRKKTERLSFIASYPIRALKKHEDGAEAGRVSPHGKIIGVINVDSPNLDHYFRIDCDKWTRDASVDNLLTQVLPDLATVAGYIFG
jgi:hypothetical protein